MSSLESVEFKELCEAAKIVVTEEDEAFVTKCLEQISEHLENIKKHHPKAQALVVPHRETLMTLHLFHGANPVDEIMSIYVQTLRMRGVNI